MMTGQILKLTDSSKAQKNKYLEHETLHLLQMKKLIHYTSRSTIWGK